MQRSVLTCIIRSLFHRYGAVGLTEEQASASADRAGSARWRWRGGSSRRWVAGSDPSDAAIGDRPGAPSPRPRCEWLQAATRHGADALDVFLWQWSTLEYQAVCRNPPTAAAAAAAAFELAR